MVNLFNEVSELYKQGFKTPKAVYEQLKKRGRDCKISTVSNYFSLIKGSRSVADNVPNTNPDPKLSNSNNDSRGYVEETSQRVEAQAQTQPQQEVKTEVEGSSLQGNNEGQSSETTNQGIENFPKQPIENIPNNQLINATGKFSLEGIKADNQPESSMMSQTYSDDFKPPVDPNINMIPVKLYRIGSFNGEITQAIMSSDRIKKATNGYEMGDEEIKMINEDTEEVLKNRLKLIDSEFGDFINLGLGYANLLLKTISHKIRNPKAKEYIEKEAEKVEDKIIKGIENETKKLTTEAGETIEVNELDKVKEENLLCQSCNEAKIYQHGMCKKCFFNAEILKGQKMFEN